MTKKHFEAAAQIIAETHYTERAAVKSAFLRLFAQFGPNFDTARFEARVKQLSDTLDAQYIKQASAAAARIRAIREYRELHKCSLKEAKEAVDRCTP